jgi:hypothetical protein
VGLTQSPIQWIPGGKAAWFEADHSPPSGAKVKNVGAMPPLPIHFHGMALNELSTGTTLPLPFTEEVMGLLLGRNRIFECHLGEF